MSQFLIKEKPDLIHLWLFFGHYAHLFVLVQIRSPDLLVAVVADLNRLLVDHLEMVSQYGLFQEQFTTLIIRTLVCHGMHNIHMLRSLKRMFKNLFAALDCTLVLGLTGA